MPAASSCITQAGMGDEQAYFADANFDSAEGAATPTLHFQDKIDRPPLFANAESMWRQYLTAAPATFWLCFALSACR